MIETISLKLVYVSDEPKKNRRIYTYVEGLKTYNRFFQKLLLCLYIMLSELTDKEL